MDQFTYDDKDINDVILQCMANVSMTGIVGSISFGEGADPIKNVKIERIQGRHFVSILYTVSSRYFKVEVHPKILFSQSKYSGSRKFSLRYKCFVKNGGEIKIENVS